MVGAAVASGGDGTSGSGPTALRAPGLTTPRRRWRPHAGAVAVLLIGFAVTATFSLGAQNFRNDNEDRLLRERVKEGAAVVGAAIPALQTQLTAAAVVAETTNGNARAFRRLMGPTVVEGGSFVSASLWNVEGADPVPIAVLGGEPALRRTPEQLRTVLNGAIGKPTMTVHNLLDRRDRRLGYASAAPGRGARYVTYAESSLPRARRADVDNDAAFADLDYALYLGTKRNPAQLLASSVGGDVPLPGRVEQRSVPFGDQRLLLVFRPRSDLGGTLLRWLPWALLGLGTVLTLAAAGLAEWLIRRREHAENLAAELEVIADENARLLADQRTVAYTLQHSLLPDRLPDVNGLDLGVRYVAGVEGVDIGGDWYDVMTMDDGRVFFVVGDVSGRGLRAATVMASLRYSIRAYATQGDDPATVLTKLSKILSVSRDGSFATVLCGIIDVPGHRVTIASAGHPYPLLVSNGQSTFVSTLNGVPVGVATSAEYESVTMSMPPDGTLLVFTDGLVERRGEGLDIGFERLRVAAVGTNGSLEDLLTKVVADVSFAGSEDDTAVLGIRWHG